MYGHHGSKAAGNMIGHLLGYDLKERGVPIAMIHVRLSAFSDFLPFSVLLLLHFTPFITLCSAFKAASFFRSRRHTGNEKLMIAWILEN